MLSLNLMFLIRNPILQLPKLPTWATGTMMSSNVSRLNLKVQLSILQSLLQLLKKVESIGFLNRLLS
ncbi:hypothetical protein LINGRAHAP2_LOCUS27908 [Linum grandiflorum]